jgi:hypothetical protein
MATPTFPSSLGKPLLSSYEYGDNLGNVDKTSTGFGYQTQKTIGDKGLSTFTIEFVFDETQMGTFEYFYNTDLINGHKWFVMGVYTGGGYDDITVRMTGEKYSAAMISPSVWDVKFAVETDEKNFISSGFYEILEEYDDIQDFFLDIHYLYLYSESYPSDYTTKLFKDDLATSIWGY